MEYALTYFGKPLTKLQFADVEHFFAEERQESDQIEFKSYPGEGVDIDKALAPVVAGITAFLNSSGGLLIWGAPKGEKVSGRKEKAVKGSLTKLPLSIEKDNLIGRIADKIIPLPRGIRVQLVATSDGQVAIFEIDESSYSPHQTGSIYYMRIDGASKPAPHHYIEALFKKVSFPQLEVHLRPGKVYPSPSRKPGPEAIHGVEVTFLFFNFSPYINEEKLSFQIELSAGYFADYEPDEQASLPLPSYHKERKQCRNAIDVDTPLPYAFPFVVVEELRFLEKDLQRSYDRISITIAFSGKTAPVKFCRYYAKFSPDRKHVQFNIGEQNRLLIDIEREQGTIRDRLLDMQGVLLPKPSDKTWMFED